MPPVRRRIVVAADAAAVWSTLTGEIGTWWPLDVLSVTGDPAALFRFDGGRLVETSAGTDHVWGEVARWEPPDGFVLAWHPGADPAEATEVEVRVTPLAGDETLVEVVHRGWDRWVDGAQAAAEYEQGWPAVLAALAGAADRETAAEVWQLVTYRPGPACAPGTAPWEQEWFAGHAAFLDGLLADGVLVAAGPVPAAGDGAMQAVLRGVDTAEAVRRATEQDLTVVADQLSVTVAPWLVIARGQLG